MSDSRYAAAGVLQLERVTPVIRALFGAFHLRPCAGDKGRARIGLAVGEAFPRWADVLVRLSELGARLGFTRPERNRTDAPDAVAILFAWAGHFSVERDERALRELGAYRRADEAADLQHLFELARRFDDGHHLTVLQLQGGWQGRRLHEFGGEARFYSREIRLRNDSCGVLYLGKTLRRLLYRKDFTEAAALIALECERLIDGIPDPTARETVQRRLLAQLTADFTDFAPDAPETPDAP
jgi:hypothetical protein